MKEKPNPTEEYERIWRGEQASLNKLRQDNPMLVGTVDVLKQWGVVEFHKEKLENGEHDIFVRLKPIDDVLPETGK